MRAQFFREDDAAGPVGTARWDGSGVTVETDDGEMRRVLERIFRASAVPVDEPGARDPAAKGPAVVEPGDLTWFRAAALVRGRAEGFRARFVTDTPGGWDPAGAYRPLDAWVMAREGHEPPPTLGTSRA
jgi:hypothetical protein